MRKQHKPLSENHIRVIKISKEALFEFLYENIIDDQETYFDVDPLGVTGTFDVNFQEGQFIFCVHKSEDNKGNSIQFPDEIDLQKLMDRLPDTTSSMFQNDRYTEYTKEELIELSRSQ